MDKMQEQVLNYIITSQFKEASNAVKYIHLGFLKRFPNSKISWDDFYRIMDSLANEGYVDKSLNPFGNEVFNLTWKAKQKFHGLLDERPINQPNPEHIPPVKRNPINVLWSFINANIISSIIGGLVVAFIVYKILGH